MFDLGRNDRCWCGSGRKYKTCHERSDEAVKQKYMGYPFPRRGLILNAEQIEGVKKSSRLTVEIMNEVEKMVKEGVSTNEINTLVHRLTTDAGAICAPLNYEGFPKSCCTSINNVICHGIPDDTKLKSGDIVNIDITTILDGYYSDMSRMFLIGEVSENARRLVEVTKRCMEIGIEAIRPFEPVSNIGNAINDYADENGYSVVRALAGHGVGLDFHDEPVVNHYRTSKETMILYPNMILTVEPMINEGDYDCEILSDEWTVVTKDNSLSAQWEHTVLITETGYEILTK